MHTPPSDLIQRKAWLAVSPASASEEETLLAFALLRTHRFNLVEKQRAELRSNLINPLTPSEADALLRKRNQERAEALLPAELLALKDIELDL